MLSLFPREGEGDSGFYTTTDAGTRALSVTVVENHFVERVYRNLASVYDLFFGPALHPGRVKAVARMNVRPGDRVLEVGVGTGINAELYPPNCSVVGIDFSAEMLEKGRERLARTGVRNMRLLQMDAADLRFGDDSFDIVYAPYLINVVPDPVQVAREMLRVCRPGGRLLFLNHFLSSHSVLSRIDRLVSPLTIHIGFKSDLDLHAFLAQSGLQASSIEKVNFPRVWSLVTCEKE